MDRASIEPLGRDSWFGSVGRLRDLASGDSTTIGQALRHAYHLIQLTPHVLRPSVTAALDERAFEDLLDADAYDIAAQALVGAPAGLAVVRQPGSRAIFAEVRLPWGQGVGCGEARTIAQAILQAWCIAVLTLDGPAGSLPASATRDPKVVPLRFGAREPEVYA